MKKPKGKFSILDLVRKAFRSPEKVIDDLTQLSNLQQYNVSLAENEKMGNRLRRGREMHGLTLTDLSSRTGIRIDNLERIESNEMIPPLADLIKIGKAMEMKIGYFIYPGVEKPLTVVRPENRLSVSRFGKKRRELYGYEYESLAAEKSDRMMEPFLVTLVPTEVEEGSNHDGQEFIFVLEGEIQVKVGDQNEILRPGDAVYYDSMNSHLVKCWGKKPAKILAVLYTGTK
jgi:transcriptional regulator with XRE-family HTH domain